MLRICNEKDCRDIWIINREEMGYDVDFEIAKQHILNVLKEKKRKTSHLVLLISILHLTILE